MARRLRISPAQGQSGIWRCENSPVISSQNKKTIYLAILVMFATLVLIAFLRLVS